METYTGDAVNSAPERFRYLRQLFEAYMSAIDQMAARFPNLKFLVRPHPLEEPETWRDHFKDTPNVAVQSGGSVIPWLIAARCVVHSACTTGIEAYILNRPVTEYHPERDSAQRIGSRASRQGHRLHPHHRRRSRDGSRQISPRKLRSIAERLPTILLRFTCRMRGSQMPIPKWPQPWRASAPLRPGLS